jgi:cytochrome c2
MYHAAAAAMKSRRGINDHYWRNSLRQSEVFRILCLMTQWTPILIMLSAFVTWALSPMASRVPNPAVQQINSEHGRQATRPLSFHPARESPTDLEISGLDSRPHYLAYSELESLPQVEVAISNDGNFPGLTLHVTGVSLDELAKALGTPASLDLIDALCTDHYRSHYPADYVAQHHPILALRIEGLKPSDWAAKTKQYDPGPYFITYDHFVPSFRVMAHEDEAQIPANVVQLNFSTAAKTFESIAPPGKYADSDPVMKGFAIAKQNCLRCHFMGDYGGTKSGISWTILSQLASQQPGIFAHYIHDPKSVNTGAQMPGNPEYDDATTAALTAYFKTFSASK